MGGVDFVAVDRRSIRAEAGIGFKEDTVLRVADGVVADGGGWGLIDQNAGGGCARSYPDIVEDIVAGDGTRRAEAQLDAVLSRAGGRALGDDGIAGDGHG